MISKDKDKGMKNKLRKSLRNIEILLRIKMGKNLVHVRSDKLIRSKVMKPGSKPEIGIILTLIE